MRTLKHPTLDDVTQTVKDDEVDAWTKQGWVQLSKKEAAELDAEAASSSSTEE
jgi:hypothetical protein